MIGNIFLGLMVGIYIYYEIKGIKGKEKLIESNKELAALIIENTKATNEVINITVNASECSNPLDDEGLRRILYSFDGGQ